MIQHKASFIVVNLMFLETLIPGLVQQEGDQHPIRMFIPLIGIPGVVKYLDPVIEGYVQSDKKFRS